jgi:hypothetical protein
MLDDALPTCRLAAYPFPLLPSLPSFPYYTHHCTCPKIKASTAAKHAFKHASKHTLKNTKTPPIPRALHKEIKYELPRLFDPRYVKKARKCVGVKAKD